MMKKYWLNIIAYSIIGLIAISIGACGNKEQSSNTLTIWGMGVEGEKLKEIVEVFNGENEDVEVKIQALPWAQAHEKLITAVAAGITPDLCQFGTTWIPEFVAIEALESLDYFIENSKTISKENYYAGSWQTGEVGGQIYGIPWYVDTRVLFYRTDVLKKAGMDHAPKTWDELKAICQKLAKKDLDGKNITVGINLPAVDWMALSMFFWSNGGRIISDDGKVVINSPENEEALEFYISFFKEQLSDINAKGGVTMYNEFKDGYTPMFVGGSWMVEDIKKHVPEIEGKWDVAVLPKKIKGTSFVGGSNWAIFKDAKNKELAWKFIEFMSEPKTQIDWYKLTKDMPTRVEAWDDEFFKDKKKIKVFGEQLSDTQSPPRTEKWEEIASKINLHMEKAVFGNISSKEALSLMEKDIKEILLAQGK